MNKYDKINEVYRRSILENCGKKHKKEMTEEEDEKKSAEYQAYFKKMLKKFGVTEPDQLKGDKKKEFFDAVDKGWKADKETDVDESVNEKVGGPGSYEDEKGIAQKMKAKGYKMVILFPVEMNLSPLYVKDMQTATSLMRKEFKTVKDYKIQKISEFMGEKPE